MSKKTPSTKLTQSIKEEIRNLYVQGVLSENGMRSYPTLEDLRTQYNVAKSTLYRVASKNKWNEERDRFQESLRKDLDQKKRKELLQESTQFDANSLTLAKAILATVGQNLRNNTEQVNSGAEGYQPSQINQLAGAALSAQRLGKLALGENTDNVNIYADKQEDSFRRAMELLDTVADGRRESDSQPVH